MRSKCTYHQDTLLDSQETLEIFQKLSQDPYTNHEETLLELKENLEIFQEILHDSEELAVLESLLTITIVTNKYGRDEDVALWALIRRASLPEGDLSAEKRKAIAGLLNISVDAFNHRLHCYRHWLRRMIKGFATRGCSDSRPQRLTHAAAEARSRRVGRGNMLHEPATETVIAGGGLGAGGVSYALKVPYCSQETCDTCAATCLRMALALRFPDAPVSEATLARQCRCIKGLGCRVKDVYRAAHRYGLPAKWLRNTRIEVEVEAALQAGCPVLANVQLRLLPSYVPAQPPQMWHSVLIIGLDERYVYLHDPDPEMGGRNQRIERAKFFADWTHNPYSAYCV
jgi:hypothetical protein